MKIIKLLLKITWPALFFVLGFILLLIVNGIQKKNRAYQKKPNFYYLLIITFSFSLLGFLSLIKGDYLNEVFFLTQVVSLLFGVLHCWVLFDWLGWAKSDSFLPETLFTLAAGSFGVFGFQLAYVLIDTISGNEYQLQWVLTMAFLWFPVPYLMYRTWHFWLDIPRKQYKAWIYPAGPPPRLNLQDDRQVMYIFVSLFSTGYDEKDQPIVQRTRLPLDATIGDFFHRFVWDFNQANIDQSITFTNEDSSGKPIGWIFFAKRNPRTLGRKLLDPESSGALLLREGDFLFARRVPLDPDQERIAPRRDHGGTGEIIFTEK